MSAEMEFLGANVEKNNEMINRVRTRNGMPPTLEAVP